MAGPSRDAIETYMSISGASESLAVQKLEEYGGNLNEAVNAHFNHITNPPVTALPYQNFDQSNDGNQPRRGIGPMLSAARSFKPSLLLDPNYRRGIYSRFTAATSSLLSPHSANTSVSPEPNPRPDQLHPMSTSHLYSHEEDEMVQAAIRASIRDAEASAASAELPERRFEQEDVDLDHAVSLSLQMQEETILKQKLKNNYGETSEAERRFKPESSSNRLGALDLDEEQQLRQNSNHGATNHPQHHEEWGGMTSEELDEAVMIEKAILGGISEATSNSSLNARQREKNLGKSSTLDTESRLLKEQQDKEFEAALLLDKQKEKESHRTMLNVTESERILALKQESLPCEPEADAKNAVTLLVRLPGGTRVCRRFLVSDKLQLLFDFIDFSGDVKPGTYRVIRSFPRRAFTVNERSSTLTELGLTNKQEALFLEMI